METTNKIQDQIDRYVLNQMSTSERIAFEQNINTDSELKESVELQEMLARAIKQRTWAERTIENAKEKAARRALLIKFTSIASSIAAILIVAFFINQSYVNSRLYDELYTQYYSYPEQDMFRSETNVDVENETLYEALDLLENNKPEEAKSKFQHLYSEPDSFKYYEAVRWYLALTELKLHNKTKAKKYLEELKDSEFYGEKVIELLNFL